MGFPTARLFLPTRYRAAGHTGGGYGSYKPDETNTGTPSGWSPTTTITGNMTTTSNGQTINNYEIKGQLFVRHNNVTVTNSLIHTFDAPTSDKFIVDCNAAITGFHISDSEICCELSNYAYTGILGREWTAERCFIHDTVDFFGAYGTSSSVNLNVNVLGCYATDSLYYETDPLQSADPGTGRKHTHNDGLQIQGGGAIVMRGCNIQAIVGSLSHGSSPYSPTVTGQAIGVTPNVNAVHDVTIDQNWLGGGAQSITMIDGNINQSSGWGTMAITKNRFARNQALISGPDGTIRRAIRVSADVDIANFPDVSALDTSCGNVWEDDGTPVKIYVY